MKPCTLKWVVNLFSFSTTMNWRYEHLLIESVRMLLQSKLRGAYRVTKVLASVFKSLQAVPCATPYGETIYIDLRVTSSYRIFAEVMWEEDEQKEVQRLVKAGDMVFDIGAHLGVYTVLLSHLVGPTGRVIAFEPNLRVLPALERTVKERKNVTLLPIALSSFSGEQVLYVPGDDSMASLADWTAGKHGEITRSVCETFTLDELRDKERFRSLTSLNAMSREQSCWFFREERRSWTVTMDRSCCLKRMQTQCADSMLQLKRY